MILNVTREGPPSQVDWVLVLVEIDQDVRNIGQKAVEIVKDNNLEDIAKGIALLAGTPYRASAAAAFCIAVFLVKAIGKIMQDNKNDQVGYIKRSFLLDDDFGVGEDGARNVELVQDLIANMWYYYTLMCRKIAQILLLSRSGLVL